MFAALATAFSLYEPADPFQEVDVLAWEPLPFEERRAAAGLLAQSTAATHQAEMPQAIGA